MNEPSLVFQSIFSTQFFLTLLFSVALIPPLKWLASKIGLVDHPGGRKQHKISAPLIGGPAIFIATAISMVIWGLPHEFQGMAIAASGLFFIGVIDDRYDISAKFRLFAQASLVAGALSWDNVWLSQITFTENYTLYLGVFQYPVTTIAILGIMNAINMLDGLDGLSSGVVLITLSFIAALSILAGDTNTSMVAVCIIGAVLGFWVYNYRFSWREKASVFMGDSGTMVLGFVLPFIAIKLSNSSPVFAPKSLLLWLFAIPIWDICAVIIKRLREGKSPLQAGRDHIHHVLMKSGLSVRHSLHLIYLLTIASISFGLSAKFLALSQVETYIMFMLFMGLYLGRVGSLTSTKKAEVYDIHVLGDRRKPYVDEMESVVELRRQHIQVENVESEDQKVS